MPTAAHTTERRPAAEDASGGGTTLDRAHFDRQTCADPVLQVEVLGLFRDELPTALSRLRTAACARDWHFAAHSLKGSARAVGATRLAALATAAEQAAAKPGTRDQLVGDIAAEIDRVAAVVRDVMATLRAGRSA